MVYAYQGGTDWTAISPSLGDAVLDIINFNGTLYAATMSYDFGAGECGNTTMAAPHGRSSGPAWMRRSVLWQSTTAGSMQALWRTAATCILLQRRQLRFCRRRVKLLRNPGHV